jgi:hypothetical protein
MMSVMPTTFGQMNDPATSSSGNLKSRLALQFQIRIQFQIHIRIRI